MAKILSYRKVTDEYTTYTLREPDYGEEDDHITELCTINGVTYVSVPDGMELPEQPEQIAETLQEVELTDDLRKQIKKASPHIRLINQRVVEMIRDRYSVDDELKMLRLAPSDESTAYNDYVEECRAWGRQEKEKLGL